MGILTKDNDMIERMELDLAAKAQSAYTAAGLSPNVHGIFSLDDLEKKIEADLCSKLAVGVGYAGALPTIDPKAPLNTAPGGNAVKMVAFTFNVILAVPTGEDCLERYSATKLLTVLRRGILGSIIDGDSASRTWAFAKEFPNVQESTQTMLYYTQVWQVILPAVSL